MKKIHNEKLTRLVFTFGMAGLVASTVLADSGTLLGPFSYGGHSYYIDTNLHTWVVAESQAVSLVGGHLVSIDDAAENSFVSSLIDSNIGVGGAAWIGLTDDSAFGGTEYGNTGSLAYPAPGMTPATTPGVQRGEGFVWLSGAPLLYQNWGSSEPNDNDGSGGHENYVHMFGPGLWNDLFSTPVIQSVFEVAPTVVPEPATASLLLLCGLAFVAHRFHRR